MAPSVSKVHLSTVDQEGNNLPGLDSIHPTSAQPPSSLSHLRERWRRDSWDPRPVQPGQPQAPSIKRLCPAPDKTCKSGEGRESESTLNPVSWKTFLLPGKQLPLCPGISKDIFYTFSSQWYSHLAGMQHIEKTLTFDKTWMAIH